MGALGGPPRVQDAGLVGPRLGFASSSSSRAYELLFKMVLILIRIVLLVYLDQIP